MSRLWITLFLLGACTSATLEPDEIISPEGPTPTWAECRQGYLVGTLDNTSVETCDLLHTMAPTAREFGIRWVLLDDVVSDIEEIATERLGSLNTLYAPVGISFRNSSTLTIEAPVATLYMDDIFFSLEEVSSDIAQYLDLDSTKPEDILIDFQTHMLNVGVDETIVADLSLSTEWSSREFLTIMARALPQEIMVVVGPLSTEQGQGGVSHPPGIDATDLVSDLVYLKSERIETAFITLPHELGHYFGLAHTHGFGIVQDGTAQLNIHALTNPYHKNFGNESVVANLSNRLGSAFEGPLGNNYIAYDAEEEDRIAADKFREAARLFWDRPSLTYKQDQRDFAGLDEFVSWTNSGKIAFLKNYNERSEGGSAINNCNADQENRVVCKYNLGQTNEVVIHGSEPFLDDSISSSAGSSVNTMSYIRVRDLAADDLKTFIHESQYEIVEVAANSPIRLHLRDYLQE